ncbi:MAG: hypothetical protein ABIH35_02070 [Patescibacteria group bacterium]
MLGYNTMHSPLSTSDIEQIYTITNSGAFGECDTAINEGCQNCCELGTVLFPGELEFLREQQERGLISTRIEIRKRIKDCFDLRNLICLMDDLKPIACRLFPEISVYPHAGLIVADPNETCLARKTQTYADSEFLRKANQVKKILGELLPFRSQIQGVTFL